MPLKTIILLPILYFLALAQGSFLPHFSLFGFTPNYVLILIVLFICLFPSFSLLSIFAGGIFLDIFSSQFLGFHVLIMLGAVLFFRIILKRYVHLSFG